MTRVLITGANGYIGGRLVGALSAQGIGRRALVREPAGELGVEQIVGDLASNGADDILARACDGIEAVVHLAGENEIEAAREPAAALAATVVATEKVAEACAAAGVQRLVYMSTVPVYGERMTPDAVLDEDMRPEPRSAYAISRLASEHVAAAVAGTRCELVVYRLTNSVGAPHHPSVDRWTLVANDLARQGATLGSLTLRSSGMQWRDFVPLPWVCSSIAAAVGLESGVSIAPGTYNLGSGHPVTVRALAEMIRDAFERETGERPELQAPAPEPDPPGPYFVQVSRVARSGLSSPSPLEQAVEETVRFCLDHKEDLS